MDWTPEMKAAAMADAQKVCDLTAEVSRLSQENERLRTAQGVFTKSRAFTAARKLVAFSCDGCDELNLRVHIRDLKTVLTAVCDRVESLSASTPVQEPRET